MTILKNIFTLLVLFAMLGCGDDSSKEESETSSTINNNFSQFIIDTNPVVSQTIKNNLTGEDNIVIYTAYGNKDTIIITGRAKKKEGVDEVSEDDGFYTNLLNIVDFFISDEIKDTPINASFDNRNYITQTDSEGYFKFTIYPEVELTTGYKIIQLNLEDNPNIHTTQASIITDDKSQTKVLGIISDIDDTILVSNVTDKADSKNFKQREPILFNETTSMNNKFREILAINNNNIPTPLFFVSGSPKQLTIPVESFLEYNQFPNHVTILKQLEGDDSFSLFSQDDYKLEQIESILELYPDIEWILFGDSGEEDEDIYETLQDDYPDQIKGFYIRDVESGEIIYTGTEESSLFDIFNPF